MALRKKPLEGIRAEPLESNLLEWHYVLEGAKASPYEGGLYHGKLLFPQDYPFKPPGIMMCTPNGRFEINRKLCLSMSDFHPEQWNPLWSVGTILMGLYSFMQEATSTHGSITTSTAAKRKYSLTSLEFNCKDQNFKELFPDLYEVYKKQVIAKNAAVASGTATGCSGSSVASNENGQSAIGQENLGFIVLFLIATLFLLRYIIMNVI